MVSYFGMVNLFDQLGIPVDEPCLPQHIGCCVFYLVEEQTERFCHILKVQLVHYGKNRVSKKGLLLIYITQICDLLLHMTFYLSHKCSKQIKIKVK